MSSGTPENDHPEAPDGHGKTSCSLLDGLACNGCRKAKLRCSRDRPSCLHCRKTGLDCVYETKRVKPGLKAGAVENLHRRLDELERRIGQQDPEGSHHVHDAHNSPHAPVSNSQGESAAYSILALLAKELPKIVNNASSHLITTPASSEPSNKRRRIRYEHDAVSMSTASDNAPTLPEPQLLQAIVHAYFVHVHPWIPMIHQARFLQKAVDEDARKQLRVMLHAMIIAASKFVSGASAITERHIQRRKWVVYTAMETLSLENTQALIIIAFDDIGNGNAAKAWSVIGSLTRTVEYMQLAQEQEDSRLRPFCQPYTSLPYTTDWTEVEERRRVFWNVFLLDRFCSVTMGWNTSLTSDDVCRRLPCDGHLWRKQAPVVTPHFGIWDKSKARIGNLMSDDPSVSATLMLNMSNVGAFAYNIEATESMSRVTTYFLQQKINPRDHNEIGSWLTRFKELDLRLVHWKRLLPQKWKTNPNLTRHVPLMDPNLTTAHVTHNASMILLHQLIAYPPLHWSFRHRLPSACSAEACYSAGVEIATITEKYLSKSTADSPVGFQYAFCLFVAARVLLCHWRYMVGNQPAHEFWSLLESLTELSRRWLAFTEAKSDQKDVFTKYATRLKELYELCAADENYRLNVLDYTTDMNYHHTFVDPLSAWSAAAQSLPLHEANLPQPDSLDAADFNTIPQSMMDQNFVDMDRVIAFDDGSMFAAAFDATTTAW